MEATEETDNFLRLTMLVIDCGTVAVRKGLECFLSSNGTCIRKVLSHMDYPDSDFIKIFYKKKLFGDEQVKLYPEGPGKPPANDLFEYDLNLLAKLNKALGQYEALIDNKKIRYKEDKAFTDNINKIKHVRDQKIAHASEPSLSDKEFQTLWDEVKSALVPLGMDSHEIDQWEHCALTKQQREKYEHMYQMCKRLDNCESELESIKKYRSEDVQRLDTFDQRLQDLESSRNPGIAPEYAMPSCSKVRETCNTSSFFQIFSHDIFVILQCIN